MSPDVSSSPPLHKVIGAALLAGSASFASAASVLSAKSKIPPHHTLTSLSLTHVQFAPDDILSKILAYVTMSPMAILCGYIGVIIVARDMKTAVLFAGQFICEAINQVLKRLVKQARPTEYLGDGYGMPSSHAQFMAFFATYTLIYMYRRGVAPDAILPHVVSVAVTIWAALVVYSRVHLYYHTWQQVVAGSISGVIFALVYYHFINNALRPQGFFKKIVDHPWARRLHIRDSETIPDVAKFDWEMWQQYRKTTQNKSE